MSDERQTVSSRNIGGQFDGAKVQNGTSAFGNLYLERTEAGSRTLSRTLLALRSRSRLSYIARSASSIARPRSFNDWNPQTPDETLIVTGAPVHCSPFRSRISFRDCIRRLASSSRS